MNDNPKSAKSQAILDEMKPLGEWLMEARPMTRAIGRTNYVNEKKKQYKADGKSDAAAEGAAYADLHNFDQEWDKKNKRYNTLATKYRKQRMADNNEVAL